ncbi:MAG: hypothetical protein JNK02_07500 [Planctomycetes bacterium]|nr:hypothetical protein [Planctomycetota bacterium]
MNLNCQTRVARCAAPAFVSATLALVGAAAWAPAAAAAPLATAATRPQDGNRDVVNLRNGQSEIGRIKSEDFAGLEIDPPRGETKRVAWADVAPGGITYADPEWQAVADLIATSKFAEALAPLEELKADTKRRAPIRQNALYFHAFALQRTGQADAALAGYKELATAFPKSRYLMQAGEGLVTILGAKKDFAGAARLLDDMAAAADASFAPAAGVLKGRLFEEQKDWAKASAAYGVAARASGVTPIVQLQAELGEARALAAQNKKTEAETALRKLVSKDGPNHLMAGVWNGLADLAQERARAANNGKGDAEQLIDALYMYLRGVVQYAPLPGDPMTEYKRSLQGSIAVFDALAQVDTVADRKRMYQQRAAQRREQLAREFP